MTVEAERIAIGSDVHANPYALEAVIADVEAHGIDRKNLWLLGDSVGYNAYPDECIRIIAEGGIHVLFGNHDIAVLQERGVETSNMLLQIVLQYATHFNSDAKKAKIYTADKLSDESIDFLKNLSFSQRFNHSIGVHSRPYSFGDFGFYFASEENDKIFQREVNKTFENMAGREKCFHDQAITVCFVGHSHHSGYITEDADDIFIPTVWGDILHVGDRNKRYIVDVGSIGQPRDGDPKASWVDYDIDKGVITFRKTPYNVDAMAKANGKAELPEYLSKRLIVGL